MIKSIFALIIFMVALELHVASSKSISKYWYTLVLSLCLSRLGLTNFNIISCFFIYTGQECKPKDSDYCLQQSRFWNHGHTCRSNTHYCNSYGKDMKRCCPESCNSGAFTEAQCEADNSIGTCIYPNKAQCHSRKLQISIRTKLKPPKEFIKFLPYIIEIRFYFSCNRSYMQGWHYKPGRNRNGLWRTLSTMW